METIRQRWSRKQIEDRLRDLKICYDDKANRALITSFQDSLNTLNRKGTKSVIRFLTF
ncbi:hypothetical protein [Mucilaginibacter sp.]|jgi:hypothetical protein|uniref:hypothetical protein n=1 Tax=Mucilaginibacter sp. TaxID=1882438 RepID=UPI00356A9ADB